MPREGQLGRDCSVMVDKMPEDSPTCASPWRAADKHNQLAQVIGGLLPKESTSRQDGGAMC